MLKKMLQLFSNNKLLETPKKLSKPEIQPKGQSNSAEILKKLGDQCFKNRDFAKADSYYKQSLDIDSTQFEVCKNLGVSQYYQGKLEEAIGYYNQAIAIKPDYPEAYSNRGLALNGLKRFDEALISLDHAIELKPDFAFAYNNKGIVLKELNRLQDSLDSHDHAILLKPDYPEAHNNRGVVMKMLNKVDDALASYDRAITLKSDYAEAFYNRGEALSTLRQFDAALESYDRAINCKPNFADPHLSRGMLLRGQNKLTEALASFDQAILLKPDYAEAYKNKGAALKDLMRIPESLENFKCAVEIEPNIELGYGFCLEVRAIVCDWSEYDFYLEKLRHKIDEGKNVSHPLIVLWFSNSAILQKKTAEVAIKSWFPETNTLPEISKYIRHKKIRIGYFSGELFNHAVCFLTAELFEKHDKTKFELIAFSYSDKSDEMTERLKIAFDKFIDVSKSSDREVVLMARSLEIDIAIDLGGFTGGSRTNIFAMRVAPIQINYLGYPGTMGAEYMDYIIADTTTIPSSHQQYYSEKVAYLPCFQVNDTKRKISDRVFSREELGLPSAGFIFCCFNNITKIMPTTFDSWMRILKKVDGSILWLLDENPVSVSNLKKEAAYRGVNINRLVFAKRTSFSEYLARYRIADLFLDTLPFNGGTTASDVLWSGLPLLTLLGEAFAGRMAASLLTSINLPELITTTQDEYEALAIELAINPEKLADIKRKLDKNRIITRLFDINHFTQHIELAYMQMYERHQAGLKPDHIDTVNNTEIIS